MRGRPVVYDGYTNVSLADDMDINFPTYLDTYIVTTASYIDSLLEIHSLKKLFYSIYIDHLVYLNNS